MMDFRISFQGDRAFIELQGRCDYSLSKKQREALSEAIISQHKLTIDFKRVSKADFVFCAFIYGLIVDKDEQMRFFKLFLLRYQKRMKKMLLIMLFR